MFKLGKNRFKVIVFLFLITLTFGVVYKIDAEDILPGGKEFNILFYKFKDENYVMPITSVGGKFDYKLGLDTTGDGKKDLNVNMKKQTSNNIKPVKVPKDTVTVFINDKKVDVKFDYRALNNKGLKAKENESSANPVKVIALGLRGSVNDSKIKYTPYYSANEFTVPFKINEYGQLESDKWISSASDELRSQRLSNNQLDYFKSNNFSSNVKPIKIGEGFADKYLGIIDPRDMEVYLPVEMFDASLSQSDGPHLKVYDKGGSQYYNLREFIYMDPLDYPIDSSNLTQYKWQLNDDFCIERFSGRMFVDCASQNKTTDISKIESGFMDKNDIAIPIRDLITDVIPLKQEFLTYILTDDNELPNPIIVEVENSKDTNLNGEYEFTTIPNTYGKLITRGYTQQSKYIFQRTDLTTEEERNIESGTCPTGDENDCVFKIQSSGSESLEPTRTHYGDRFTMYATDFVEDGNVSPDYGIRSCRDLESIGRGEAYEGATHHEAWPLNGTYYLENDLDCTNTSIPRSIFDDNYSFLSSTDGFNSIGFEQPFTGTLDGRGHTITGLYSSNNRKNDGSTPGIFAKTSGATIKDINIVDSSIEADTLSASGNANLLIQNATNTTVKNINITSSFNDETGGNPAVIGTSSSSTYNNITINNTINSDGLSSDSSGFIANSNGDTITNLSGNVTLTSPSSNFGSVIANSSGSTIDNADLTVDLTNDSGTIGGLVGSGSSEITNSKVNGNINSKIGNIGGLVGLVGDGSSNINSSYFSGVITVTQDEIITDSITNLNIGGLVGLVGDGSSNINNSYSKGNVNVDLTNRGNKYNNQIFNISALVGELSNGSINNSYSSVDVNVTNDRNDSSKPSTINIGGLAAEGSSFSTNNAYYGGYMNYDSTSNVNNNVNIGGLIGKGFANLAKTYSAGKISITDNNIKNNYNLGGFLGQLTSAAAFNDSYSSMNMKFTGKHGKINSSMLVGKNDSTVTASNTYSHYAQSIDINDNVQIPNYSSPANLIDKDDNNSVGIKQVIYDELITTPWYTNIGWSATGSANTSGYTWNSPFRQASKICHSHLYDESKNGSYLDGQKCIPIPKRKAKIENYKIDAMSLDLIIRITYKTSELRALNTVKVYENGTTLVNDISISETPITDGVQNITITNDGGIKPDTNYKIEVTSSSMSSSSSTYINIHTPKQVQHDGQTYALIGDNVNISTDNEDLIDSDITTPTTEEGVYGLYELESVCYEDANGINSDIENKNAWTKKDLTISKYDHIIRPCDGNYLVANNIDASKSSTETTTDNAGGFGEDGFRPIGQKVKTADGVDSTIFTGEITGDVDTILSDPKENTYIKNMYINKPETNYIGMISKADDASINNLALVDPSISGKSYVGSFVGAMEDTDGKESQLLNLYAAKSTDDSSSVEYDIKASGDNVGGIVGSVSNVTLTSDSSFAGSIPGVDSSLLTTQPSQVYPDKDGYKTFSTLDVKSGGLNVGSIVGLATDKTTLTNTYAKSSVKALENAGGVVGKLELKDIANKINVANTYFDGNVQSDKRSGGIIGHTYINNSIPLMNKEDKIVVQNSYSYGNIIADIEAAGGIIGNMAGAGTVENTSSYASVTSGQYAGGITNLSNASYFNIKNNIYKGIVKTTKTSGPQHAGGIVGTSPYTYDVDSKSGLELINNYSEVRIETKSEDNLTGSIIAEPVTDQTGDPIAIVKNNYTSVDSVWDKNGTVTNIFPIDEELETDSSPDSFSPEIPLPGELHTPDWWKEELFVDDRGANWNVDKNDATIPSPDSDITDESADNKDGTVNRGYYPTVKQIDGSNPTDQEILEQKLVELPEMQYNAELINYKINASTLEVDLLVNNNEGARVTIKVDATIYVNDEPVKDVEIPEGVSSIEIEQSDYRFEPDTDYNIAIEAVGGARSSINIHTPKQVEYSGQTYALIGDGVNTDTDIDDVIASDISTPSTVNASTIDSTKKAYGIYELESICYENANGLDNTKVDEVAWGEDDLTITKYDHIIRPCDGNYLIADNIDAIQSKNKTTADKAGGFGADGYRPIGQVADTADGNDSIAFTGEITGDIDTILADTRNNTYIKDMYISQPTINNVGMLSKGNDALINNLGIVDPSVEGKSAVASFAGEMNDTDTGSGDGSELLNIYALESTDDSASIEYDIKGSGTNVGGIVGKSYNTKIYSDDKFIGNIAGIDSSLLINQPSKIYPDKDGYKTFNTLDVKGNGYSAGGIIGTNYFSNINNVYNKGSILNDANAGGIVGAFTETNINNAYNSGNIYTSTGYGAGIAANSNNDIDNEYNEISNVYNIGNVTSKFAATGIVGDFVFTNIKNVYNTGTMSLDESVTTVEGLGVYASGIASNVEDDFTESNNNTITNAINLGTIDANNAEPSKLAFAGIVADGALEPDDVTIINALNAGKLISNTDANYYSIAKTPSTKGTSKIVNTYAVSGTNDESKDSNKLDSGFEYVSSSEIAVATWWKDILFTDDNGENWNIDAGDVKNPNPDIDINDESPDNKDGTVNRGYYPTLKEINDRGNPIKQEVLEQTLINIPIPDYTVDLVDYKINAMTLDIMINIQSENEVKNAYSIMVENSSGVYTENIIPDRGQKVFTISSVDAGIKPDEDQTISLLKNSVVIDQITIHTPKQYVEGGGAFKKGTTTASIGDVVNSSTYVSTDVGDYVNTAVSTPLTETGVYGIYELESICYEQANGFGNEVPVSNEWTADDLTLTKYDHIVRPCDGKYTLETNVNADATKNNTDSDKAGGFGTDGFRPIGSTSSSTVISDFSGTLNGIVEGDYNANGFYNSKINGLYINNTVEDTGLFASILGASTDSRAQITNIGLEYPIVNGVNNTGALAGTVENANIINVYASENPNTEDVLAGSIEGSASTGGLIGVAQDNTLIENGYTKFTTTDNNVSGTNNVGGIVGTNNGANINTSYTQTKVEGTSEIGGITGYNAGALRNIYSVETVDATGANAGGIVSTNDGSVYNGYSTSTINADKYAGGISGKTVTGSTIDNMLYSGNITANSNVMGIAGDNVGTINNSFVYNNSQISRGGSTVAAVDDTQTMAQATAVTSLELSTPTWWLDTLWLTNNDDLKLWQITDRVSIRPTGYYPWVHSQENPGDDKYLVGGQNIGGSREDMPLHQPDISLPSVPSPKILDYKIDAMTLDITLKVELAMSYTDLEVSVSTPADTITKPATYDSATQTISLNKTDFPNIDQDTEITIQVIGDTILSNELVIHTPKIETIDGKDFMVLGDGAQGNSATDVKDSISSDKIEPGFGTDTASGTSTTPDYGIYELESIGYAETETFTEWSEDDLTLAKYDHIIRPLEGNYVIKSDLDASDTKSNTKEDKEGGFGTDGYRPIEGHVVGIDGEGRHWEGFVGEFNGNQKEIQNLYSLEGGVFTHIGDSESMSAFVYDLGITGDITGSGALSDSVQGAKIYNCYNKANVTDGSGLVDYLGPYGTEYDEGNRLLDGRPSEMFNVYNYGNITGGNGVVGELQNSNLENAYNTGSVTGGNGVVSISPYTIVDWKSFMGKTNSLYNLGEVTDGNGVFTLNNTIEDWPIVNNPPAPTRFFNAGKVTVDSITAGGAIYKDYYRVCYWSGPCPVPYPSFLQPPELLYGYELGQISYDGGASYNSFKEHANIISGVPEYDIIDYNANKSVTSTSLNTVSWWKDTFFGSGFESSWDEENDIPAGFYPKVNRVDRTGNAVGGLVRGQEDYPLPGGDEVEIMNYKIDADTLDIYLKYDIQLETKVGISLDITITDTDTSTVVASKHLDNVSKGDIVKIPNPDTDTISGTGLTQDNEYLIEITSTSSFEPPALLIHTPKQEKIDGKTYQLIGDGVNSKTDVNDVINSDKVNPETEGGVYGVYELESICYEDANPKDSAYDNPADWTSLDLTLRKYDHIIRDCDDNIKITGDGIDATVSKENEKSDISGGFETDGFRPIGQIIGSESDFSNGDPGRYEPELGDYYTGENALDYNGSIIGDEALSIVEISNMYIDQPDSNDIGIIAHLAGEAKNIRIEEVDLIKGILNVGTIAGVSKEGSIVTDTYANDTVATVDQPSLEGVTVGGLVGLNAGDILNSHTDLYVYTEQYKESEFGSGGLAGINSGNIENSYSEGSITGVVVSGGLVGYNKGTIEKSYSDSDMIMQGNTPLPSQWQGYGGLVGRNIGVIDDTYATGTITATNTTAISKATCYVGGLVGNNSSTKTKGYIYNSYSDISLEQVGISGGLVGNNDKDGEIHNSYATGDVSYYGGDNTITYEHTTAPITSSVGGLVGVNSGIIKNVYAVGNVEGMNSTGGLIGINTRGQVSEAYSLGDVTGAYLKGGRCTDGYWTNFLEDGWNPASRYDCTSIEEFNYSTNIGGLIGQNRSDGYTTGGSPSIPVGDDHYSRPFLDYDYNTDTNVENVYSEGNVSEVNYTGPEDVRFSGLGALTGEIRADALLSLARYLDDPDVDDHINYWDLSSSYIVPLVGVLNHDAPVNISQELAGGNSFDYKNSLTETIDVYNLLTTDKPIDLSKTVKNSYVNEDSTVQENGKTAEANSTYSTSKSIYSGVSNPFYSDLFTEPVRTIPDKNDFNLSTTAEVSTATFWENKVKLNSKANHWNITGAISKGLYPTLYMVDRNTMEPTTVDLGTTFSKEFKQSTKVLPNVKSYYETHSNRDVKISETIDISQTQRDESLRSAVNSISEEAENDFNII